MTKDERAGVVKPEKGLIAIRASLDVEGLKVDGFTIKGVPIASDRPVLRSFGEERLVVTEDAIALEKFRSSGIPLLSNHNPNDRRLGTLRNPVVKDGVLYADIEFDKRYDVAVDVFRSITEDKQPQDLSIGYFCNKWEATRMGESLSESHRITKYEIRDVSVVGLGADQKSGFRRSATCATGGETNTVDSKSSKEMTKGATKADNNQKVDAKASDQVTDTRAAESVKDAPKATPAKERAASAIDLMDLAEEHGVDSKTAKEWIRAGVTLSAAKDSILEGMKKRNAEMPKVRFTDAAPKEDEKKHKEGNVELSMRGAIDALVAAKRGESKISKEAGLAREVSQELGGGSGLSLRVPYDALNTRSFEASETKQGQKLITDQVRMDQFQRFLYNNTVIGKLGIKRMTGLKDNVLIPRQTKSNSASYVGESSAATYTDMEADNIKLEPHTAIAITRITNLAKAQMPAVQSILQDDLLTQLRIAVDRTTLIGGGTNEPAGIMATAGVNTARTGNTGTKTRKFDLDEIITVLGEIQDANVTGQAKIVAPPSLINYWRKQKDSDGQYLWSANTDMSTVMDVPGFLFGLPIYSSTNLRLSGDAATDFRLLVGVFDYCVMAFWGSAFNLEIGTSGNDFASDQASIRAVVYHDAAVTRTDAFKSFTKIEV